MLTFANIQMQAQTSRIWKGNHTQLSRFTLLQIPTNSARQSKWCIGLIFYNLQYLINSIGHKLYDIYYKPLHQSQAITRHYASEQLLNRHNITYLIIRTSEKAHTYTLTYLPYIFFFYCIHTYGSYSYTHRHRIYHNYISNSYITYICNKMTVTFIVPTTI